MPLDALPGYGLANTVTGVCTMLAGALPLWFCAMLGRQPRRWVLVYALTVVTGIFTVTLHGFGETNPMFLPRWVWAFLDTGSNILVASAIGLAALKDFYSARVIRWAGPLLTALMLAGIAWHFVDRAGAGGLLIDLPGWGGFNPGETWLVGLSILNTALFAAKWRLMPPSARPLIGSAFIAFLIGGFLASADNAAIIWPFIPAHALWHIVGATGLTLLWAFNHARRHG
jgi:hypothetical protein